ncbi:MAG TPA: hypothetical protein VHM30_00345 [Gemmatimonadaceae bacterium]|nr:hypothetical protein [Gemmatimonadaceae bacterium]
MTTHEPETTPYATAIAEVLAVRRSTAFATALQQLDTASGLISFAQRPGILGRVGLLATLALALSERGGLRLFLDTPDGDGFRKLVTGCRAIGARKTERLLAAVAALYPRGRVPRDEGDRIDATAAIEGSRSIVERFDPFDRVQRAHRGAFAELIACLRRYVRAQAPALARGLARAERDRVARAAALKTAKKSARTGKTNRRSAKRPTRRAREVRPRVEGVPRGRESLDRPGYEIGQGQYPLAVDEGAIIAGLAALDVKGWRALVMHWIANARVMGDAKDEQSSTLADVLMGWHFPRAQVSAWIAEGRRRWAPAEAAADALPETMRIAGKTIPFRKAALRVQADTKNAAMLYPLHGGDNGRGPSMTILRPVMEATGVPIPEPPPPGKIVARRRR